MNGKGILKGKTDMLDFIKYCFTSLGLTISASFGNNPDGLTLKNSIAGILTSIVLFGFAALMLYLITLVARSIRKNRNNEDPIKQKENTDMTIKKIKEDEYLVSDGEYELLCCAWQFYGIKNVQNYTLSSFMAKDIMRATDRGFLLEKSSNNHFGYKIVGELIDFENAIVRVGEFNIEIDSALPKDLIVGDFIEFNVSRIDIDFKRE